MILLHEIFIHECWLQLIEMSRFVLAERFFLEIYKIAMLGVSLWFYLQVYKHSCIEKFRYELLAGL